MTSYSYPNDWTNEHCGKLSISGKLTRIFIAHLQAAQAATSLAGYGPYTGVTPFLRMIFAYLLTSPVATTA